MELTWLEDLLALAEHRSFTRAAVARHVTQPAFGRRIRALEGWVGAPLVQRSREGARLTAAGEALHARAAGVARDIHAMRAAARRAAGLEAQALTIAATHALSFTVFPAWVRGVAPPESLGRLHLVSDTLAACERILRAGEAAFLLCHAAPGAPPEEGFLSLPIGADALLPLRAPGAAGTALPGTAEAPARLLAYAPASGLARILGDAWRHAGLALEPVFTAPAAAALHTMARQGHGLAWLPQSLAAEDLAAGRLEEAAPGFAVPVEIRLLRPRRRLAPNAEAFWAAARRHAGPAGTADGPPLPAPGGGLLTPPPPAAPPSAAAGGGGAAPRGARPGGRGR